MIRKSISKRILLGILLLIFTLGASFALFNRLYVNYLWFNEVGYTQVFMKELVSKLKIGIPTFAILFLLLFTYLKFLTKLVLKKTAIIKVKAKSIIPFALSLFLSLFIALISTNSLWYKWLEFLYSVDFNQKDPLYHKDISFYVFRLPFLEQLNQVLTNAICILVITTILYSAIVFLSSPNKIDINKDGKVDFLDIILGLFNLVARQISVFMALIFFMIGFHYYIKIFNLLYSKTGIAYGASFTDVKITLPFYLIIICLSILFGIFSILSGIQGKYKRLILGPIVLVVISLGGSLVTVAVDKIIVAPNEYEKEEVYLARNIEYTQAAYGIDKVKEIEFQVDDEIASEEIEENNLTINNIPINDYRPTLDMFNSIQGFRVYYQFNDIDIDRYYVDGIYTQVFISPREIRSNKLEDNVISWTNKHLKYTHGMGIAVSPVNEVNSAGQPPLLVKDIPPETTVEALKLTEPRIYFGESTNSYAITNSTSKEFDYPKGSNNAENDYNGTAGIPLNLFNRLAFTLYHGESNIMLTSEIASDSKMIIRRNIIERVSSIAPFLIYDEDPYIVVANGKLYWIMDAFTTSDRYPYAQPYDKKGSFNYIRNSVKVVVDAYNGSVDFYQVNEDDPIINVYNKIYPEMFKPMDQMAESLKDHVRYSQEMFDIQSKIFKSYHMNSPRVFYNKEDQWEIATQIYGKDKEVENVESAYLIMKQPESVREEFVLMVPFTPREKDNMIGWMAAMNDRDNYGELIVYKFPKQYLAYGPMQIEQRIDQDTTISPQLTLLGQQGSQISRGNMITIPINNSMLYVEPIYITASGTGRKLPEVKKVIVSYDNKIVMADSFDLALEVIFGASKGEEPKGQGEAKEEPDTEEEINSRITKANQLLKSAQKAQEAGKWAEYGKYMEELEKVLDQLGVR